MIYPPKKRAYSPEPAITKDLSHLVNINSKFAGSGGSTRVLKQTHPRWLRRSRSPSPRPSSPASSRKKSKPQTQCRKLLSEPTLFRKYYDRGDLPIAVSFHGATRKVSFQ